MIHALGVDITVPVLITAITVLVVIILCQKKKAGFRVCIFLDVNLLQGQAKYIRRYTGVLTQEEMTKFLAEGYQSMLLKQLKSKKVTKVSYETVYDLVFQFKVHSGKDKTKKVSFTTTFAEQRLSKLALFNKYEVSS